jgi:hypothetical protein
MTTTVTHWSTNEVFSVFTSLCLLAPSDGVRSFPFLWVPERSPASATSFSLLTGSESESHCDWRSVSLSLLILITVWQLLSCPWEGALSDERTDLSFVSQPAVLGQLSVCTIFTFNMCHMLLNTCTIYTRPLSVRAQYSRLCPISGSFPITAV